MTGSDGGAPLEAFSGAKGRDDDVRVDFCEDIDEFGSGS